MAKIHCMKAAMFMAVIISAPFAHADDLETRVAQLERMVNARSLSQIEMQQQIDSLTNDVRSLRGQLEEANYKLQQATDRQKALYQEIDKLQQAAPAAPPADSAAQSTDNSNNVAPQPQASAQPAAAPATTPVPAAAPAPASGSESKDYETAVNLVLRDKKYDQAIPAFESFVTNYPASASLPGAYYWLGQLYLNKGDRDKARSNFLTVAQKYKDSPKRPEAIYKLGIIAKADGDAEKANKFFELVIKQYPNTSVAQLAKKAMGG